MAVPWLALLAVVLGALGCGVRADRGPRAEPSGAAPRVRCGGQRAGGDRQRPQQVDVSFPLRRGAFGQFPEPLHRQNLPGRRVSARAKRATSAASSTPGTRAANA